MKLFYFLIIIISISILPGQGSNAIAQTYTFNYTGSAQYWTVPPCVSSIEVNALGGIGGHSPMSHGGSGGNLHCLIAVTPGQVLGIFAGKQGDTSTSATFGIGGFNGGGNGSVAVNGQAGGGGGGASDIRISPYTLADRILVAAGGGGAGYDCVALNADIGGDGGGLTGDDGYNCSTVPGVLGSGFGGTQIAGGLGGNCFCGWNPGNDGALGKGGDGGAGPTWPTGGGGGGGGWYGGGGGSWGGGGGGSSYADPTYATSVSNIPGTNPFGDGSVTLILPCDTPGYIASGTLCTDDSVLFFSSGSASCGTWTSSNTSVCQAGISYGYIRGVSPGTATITYSLRNPCTGVSAYQTVTVLPGPAPIEGTSRVCPGDSVILSDATPFGHWSSSDPVIAKVGATGIVKGKTQGTATITYTAPDGCNTYAPVIVDCSNGISQTIASGSDKPELYPNPASNTLTIKMSRLSYTAFTITNSIGQVFLAQQLIETETYMNVKQLPPGLYYITLKGPGGNNVQKFIKE